MRWLCSLPVVCLLVAAIAQAEAPAEENGSDSQDLPVYSELERSHWSFQPRSRPAIPEFTNRKHREWVRSPIDAFILKRLKEEGLSPAPPADRRVLIRRVCYDLTGLPPSPEEIETFLADRSPRAYEKLIDRYLSSPHYGERWGRHWLDVVRFAETEGFEYDRYRPFAWRFRDYVIRSFNEDKPFDRFVLEQLAGDEIASDPASDGRQSAGSETDLDLWIAAGFHRLGPVRRNAGNAEVAFSRNEVLTEMTDIIGSAFLGLSVSCARCHDHMYDPIRQTDYYRLQAFLAATNENEISLVDQKRQKQWQAETDKINRKIENIKEQLSGKTGEEERRLRKQLAETESKLPNPLPSIFTVRNYQQKRTPIHLLKRGDEFQPLQKLGMRELGILLPDEAPELPAGTKRPRTRLAKWITDPEHPLTARVIVNRIWQYHFGRGIVATPNDFGANGAQPTHPELLDWLANQFVSPSHLPLDNPTHLPFDKKGTFNSSPPLDKKGTPNNSPPLDKGGTQGGWTFKQLHRIILLSSTYRQAAVHPQAEAAMKTDPQNRLHWHFSRRRLTAEEIRDSMLSVSGRLNGKTGGPSIMVPVDRELINLLYKPTQWQVTEDPDEHDRRSIYLIAKRNLRLPFLEVFDQPDLQTSCFSRTSSTHAPQALELLNGELSNQLARAFAKRLKREAGDDREKQIERVFLLATGSPPTEQQKTMSLEFLKTSPLEEFTLALFNLNAFLYVE